MLINPFRAKRSWPLLLLLAAVFLGLFARYGVVFANDSYTYINGSVRVSPLYPALIALFRAVFPAEWHLEALVVTQELLAAYAIFSLMAYLRERFSIGAALGTILSLGFTGAYMLRLVLVGEEALYCNAILTEAITYPLYFLFVKYAFAAFDQADLRPLVTAFILAFLLACTRGQMLFLLPVLLVVFLLILRGRRPQKGEKRLLWLHALLMGAGFFAGISLTSAAYNAALSGVAAQTTMGAEAVFGALLYNSGAEDAALFAEGSEEREILFETLTRGETEGLTYKSAPKDVLGHFQHYEASHDPLRGVLLEVIGERYRSELPNDDATRLILVDYAGAVFPALLADNLGEYLYNALINCFGGLVRANSIMRRAGVLWSALVYALCAGFLLLSRGRISLDPERRLMQLILLSALANAAFCAFGVFALSRYVYYNFPCMYLALALYAIALWKRRRKGVRV